MKFLARIEKKKISWLLIILCMLFFFLRFPSIIEPYWYGDEGIYEVIGQSLNHGSLLYRDIWDNKPPLLYVVYALAQGDQSTVKVFSIIAGILAIIGFFLLSQKIFNKLAISTLTTTLFVILLGTPLLEGNIANAEDFILFPIILAGLLIYRTVEITNVKKIRKTSFVLWLRTHTIFLTAGLLLGIAFLFKIVAVFDLTAFVLFFIIFNLPEHVSFTAFQKSLKQKTKFYEIIVNLRPLILSFLVPFILTFLYFTLNNAVKDFLLSAFLGNIDYVGWENNFLGIPQGLLITKFLALILTVAFIIWKRKYFTKPKLFISLWVVFAFFNAFFSGRPYTHYAIVLLPSFCLLIGLFFFSTGLKTRLLISTACVIGLLLVHTQFPINQVKSYQYYSNAIHFMTGQKNVEDYESFFDAKTPRDYAIASFIISHTRATDSIYIWGNNPQIYALSHKLPPDKYTVAYHVIQDNAFDQTALNVNKAKPKYIIVLKESDPLPFAVPLYIMRYSTTGATIYERTL